MKNIVLNYQFGEKTTDGYGGIRIAITFPVVRYHHKVMKMEDNSYEEYIIVVTPNCSSFRQPENLSLLESWKFDSDGFFRYTTQWPLYSVYETRDDEITFKFKKL